MDASTGPVYQVTFRRSDDDYRAVFCKCDFVEHF